MKGLLPIVKMDEMIEKMFKIKSTIDLNLWWEIVRFHLHMNRLCGPTPEERRFTCWNSEAKEVKVGPIERILN